MIINEALNRPVLHFLGGNLSVAEGICRAELDKKADNPDKVLHLMALISKEQGSM